MSTRPPLSRLAWNITSVPSSLGWISCGHHRALRDNAKVMDAVGRHLAVFSTIRMGLGTIDALMAIYLNQEDA